MTARANESAEDLAYRLAFYRQVKVCAAFLRERLDDQPFLPGATRKPLPPEGAQLRLPIPPNEAGKQPTGERRSN